MGTSAIFHSCAFFPPFPKLGSKCTDRKTDLGACGRARCRKQAHVAALVLPSVLPHYPDPRAVPAAPAPAGARAWWGWLSASSHPILPSRLLPLHHTNHHPGEFAGPGGEDAHICSYPHHHFAPQFTVPQGKGRHVQLQRVAVPAEPPAPLSAMLAPGKGRLAGGRTGAVPPH